MIKLYSLFPAVFVLLISLLFISCGKDTVTGGTGNPPTSNETLIYSFDSVSIYGSGPQYFTFENGIDTLDVNDSIKVYFVLSSNCGVEDTASASLSLGNLTGFTFYVSNYQELNKSQSFYHKVSVAVHKISYSLYFNSIQQKFIKMRDIKIYKY